RARDACAQYALTIDIALQRAIHIGQVDVCRDVVGIQPEGGGELGLRLQGIAALAVEGPEVHARVRAIGAEVQYIDEVGSSSPERDVLLRVELVCRCAGEGSRGFSAQRARRIGQQRRGELC